MTPSYNPAGISAGQDAFPGPSCPEWVELIPARDRAAHGLGPLSLYLHGARAKPGRRKWGRPARNPQ